MTDSEKNWIEGADYEELQKAAQNALELLTRLTLIPTDDELEQAREEGWGVTRTEILDMVAALRATLPTEPDGV